MLGVIGGTGFENFFKGMEVPIHTHYGTARVILDQKHHIAFLPRHGFDHTVIPHNINHRANISAMKKLGVKGVVGINACGIISRFSVGDIVLIQDFIAFHAPIFTFLEKLENLEQHSVMNPPFSKSLGDKIISAARKAHVRLKKGGIVAFANGPRYETPAEVKAFQKLGANLVNMTIAPEAILAKEYHLDYCAIAVATDKALATASGKKILDVAHAKNPLVAKIVLALGAVV